MKKILIFSLIFLFSVFKIINVLAAVDSVTINEIEISEKSDTAVVNEFSYEGSEVKSDITFYNLEDYITYKITLRNNENFDYTLRSINYDSENEYIMYEFKYSDEVFKAKGTKVIYVTAKYTNEVQDITERVQSGNIELQLTLEDEDGNTKEDSIDIIDSRDNGTKENDEIKESIENDKIKEPIENNNSIGSANQEQNVVKIDNEKSSNPQTGDKVGIYLFTAIISFIVLNILVRKKYSKKVSRGIKFFSFIILVLVLVPTIAKANSNGLVFTFKNTYNLYDKLVMSYDVNGEIKQRIVRYNTTLADLGVVTADGYIFKGWYTEPTGGIEIEGETNISEDLTYYAQFDIIDYNITYNLNGGQATNPSTYTVEDKIILNNPEKEGYTFSGWTGSNGSVLQTKVTIDKGSTGNKEYTANYSVNTNTKYTVIHKLMDLDGKNYTIKDTEELEGATDTIVEPQTNIYEGFTAPDTEKIKITADGKAEVIYEYTRNLYELTLNNTNYIDLENSTPSGQYYYGTPIRLIAKNKTGYMYTGWSNGKIEKELNFDLSEDTTIEPLYEANTYQVIFDKNGGAGQMENQIYTYAKSQKLRKNTFTREGYTYNCWNTEPDGSGTDYQDEQSVSNLVTEGTITLYAKYTPNNDTPYKVVHELMNLDGETYTEKETQNLKGTTDSTIKPEVKSYYGFTSPEETDLTITSNGEATITYRYTRNKYTLTIGDEDGVDFDYSTAPGEYYYETSIKLKAKDKSHEIFNKWSNDETTREIEFALTEDTNITPIFYTIGYFMSYAGRNNLFGFSKNITYFGRGPRDLTLQDVQAKTGSKLISNTQDDGYKSEIDVYGWVEDSKFYWWSEADFVYFHPDTTKAFCEYSNLVTVDLNGTSTEKVKSFAHWFDTDKALVEIKGKIVTDGLEERYNQTYDYTQINNNNSSDTSLTFMFNDCNSLESVDLSGFNTENATDMKRMFAGCKKLGEIDVSSFNTSKVISMYWMYRNCQTVTSIDLSNFDTSNVVNMYGMFLDANNVQTVILGENFDTSKVVRMDSMFYGMSRLTTIYVVNDFNRDSVSSSTDMFNKTTNIVGGMGTEYQTTYNNSYKDATYAQISNEYQSGYFTKSR